MKQVWHYLFVEPCTWFFYCLFQPSRFKKEMDIEGILSLKRAILMLRIAIPAFFISYFLSLVIAISFYHWFPVFFAVEPNPGTFLLTTAFNIAIGLMIDIVEGFLGGLQIGFASSFSWGMAGGIAGTFSQQPTVPMTIVGGLVGIATGLAVRIFARRTKSDKSRHFETSIAWGIAMGLMGSTVGSLVGPGITIFAGGLPLSIVGGLTGGLIGSLIGQWMDNIGKGIEGTITAGILMVIVVSGIGSIVVGAGWAIRQAITVGMQHGIVSGIILGLILLLTGGLLGSTMLGIILGPTLRILRISVIAIVTSILVGCSEGFARQSILWGLIYCFGGGLTCMLGYLIGYYRLPLYPISSLSTLLAYLQSHKHPERVFSYLHRSALYWDECVYFPLPRLQHILLLAASQNIERTLEEITFIVAERPQQLQAARKTSIEIALCDLEKRLDMQAIAQAAHQLGEILPQEAGLIDSRWITPFVHIIDASRDAARFCSPLGWQAKRNALDDMTTNLKRVHPNTAFRDPFLDKRLEQIVRSWNDIAHEELSALNTVPEKTRRVHNPYKPGPVLLLSDSLFVGRRDLAQHLEEAMSNDSYRPTFLLHGERRMGKSSTIKQLPNLLGARFLPIFYDLQMRGMSSSIDIFLGRIAEEIFNTMGKRGIVVKKLKYEQLEEAHRKNEATVYYVFERWLKDVERSLAQQDRILLLAFDEFEKLAAANKSGNLDLELLLDWFRSVIQHASRIVLLFSGVRTFGDMGTDWVSSFVNVQTLKVSFLHSSEAYQLITQPEPNFPSQEVFNDAVVEEIMRLTNCHPFLIQAICSALIDKLNIDSRIHAEPADITAATQRVLKNWGSTYFRDMWERTDSDQRQCLFTLRKLASASLDTLEQQSGLDAYTLHCTLETLTDRDLVTENQGIYQIAAPLFSAWIDRLAPFG